MADTDLSKCGCGLQCPWPWNEAYKWVCQPCHERRRSQPQTVSDMRLKASMRLVGELKRCAAGMDGECCHELCPQIRDGEPKRSGRHCPLDVAEDDDR